MPNTTRVRARPVDHTPPEDGPIATDATLGDDIYADRLIAADVITDTILTGHRHTRPEVDNRIDS